MIKLIIVISSFLLVSVVNTDSIYSYSITTIEGINNPLSAYEGKKLLVITLPVTQNSNADSLLHTLDSLGNANTNSLVIIAAPSYEDGYSPENKTTLKNWYRSLLGNNIIVTDGLYSRNTSGNLQHPLFKWLTDKDKNRRFNKDVDGPENKFLISANGKLFAVMVAGTKLEGNTMNRLLQAQ